MDFLAQFVINNNEVKHLMILLSADKKCKQIKLKICAVFINNNII